MPYSYSRINFDPISSQWKGFIDPSTSVYTSGILHDLDLIFSTAEGFGLLTRGTRGSGEIDFVGFTAQAGDSPASAGNTPQGYNRPTVNIDYNASSQVFWFNKNGFLVNGTTALVIAHELSHAVDITYDPQRIEASTNKFVSFDDEDKNASGFDFKGPAVKAQNAVASQLGLDNLDRVSYEGITVGINPSFSYTASYTDGQRVSVVRFGDQFISLAPPNGVQRTKNYIDHSQRADNSADLIFGFSDDDYIHGGGGNDHLYGGDGIDTMFGGLGHDRLFGEGDDDVLAGNVGSDLLHGGYNSAVSAPGQFTTDGFDTADYKTVFPAGPKGEGIRIEIGGDARSTRYEAELGADFAKAVFVKDLNPDRDGAVDTLISIETILGTDGDDRVRISKLDSAILADKATGQGGISTIDLGGQVSAKGDVLDLSGLDEDAIVDLPSGGFVGSRDLQRYVEVQGVETILGSVHNDEITGNRSTSNTIVGGGGNDILRGGDLTDRITGRGFISGGGGDDIIVFEGPFKSAPSTGPGPIISGLVPYGGIEGGPGNDRIRLVSDEYASIYWSSGDGFDRVTNVYSSDAHTLNLDNFVDSEYYGSLKGYGVDHRLISFSFDVPRSEVTIKFFATSVDKVNIKNPGQEADIRELLFGHLDFFYHGEKVMTVDNILGVTANQGDARPDRIGFSNVDTISFSDTILHTSLMGSAPIETNPEKSEIKIIISSSDQSSQSQTDDAFSFADNLRSEQNIDNNVDDNQGLMQHSSALIERIFDTVDVELSTTDELGFNHHLLIPLTLNQHEHVL